MKTRAQIHWLSILLLVIFSMKSLKSVAGPAPQGLVVQGSITGSSQQPVESASVNFTLEVLSPAPKQCLLYKEFHTLNMTNSGGVFSLILGSGTRSTPSTAYSDTSTISQAFSNIEPNHTSLTCASSTSYQPVSGDQRLLRITFNDGSGDQTLSQLLPIQSVPFALWADSANDSMTLGGVAASGFIQTNNDSGKVLTQANLESIFSSSANLTELQALIAGTSTSFTGPSSPNFSGTVTAQGGIIGSSVSGGDLTLDSTSHATKGDIILAPNGGKIGIGTTTPSAELSVVGSTNISNDLSVAGAGYFGDLSVYTANVGATMMSAFNNGGTPLVLRSNNNGTFLQFTYNSSKDWAVGIPNADTSFSFYENKGLGAGSGTERMRIAAGGNVGIGTTNPQFSLDARGKAAIVNSGNLFPGSQPHTAILHSQSSNYSGALNVISVGGDTVGAIHAAVAQTYSEVAGDPNYYALIGERMNNNGSWNATSPGAVANGDFLPGIAFAGQTNTSTGTGMSIGATIHGRVDGSVASDTLPTALVFRTTQTNTTSMSERMRISSNGNVGIGTTNPTSPLSVNTSDYTKPVADFTSACLACNVSSRISNSGNQNGSSATIEFGLSTAGGSIVSAGKIGATRLSSGVDSALVMGPMKAGNYFEAMRIDNNGNVGIGTTSPNSTLHVVGAAGTVGSPNGTQGLSVTGGSGYASGNGAGGSISLTGGAGTGSGGGGGVTIIGGSSGIGGGSGQILIRSGHFNNGASPAGGAYLQLGSSGSVYSADVLLSSGDIHGSGPGGSGNITIRTPNAASGVNSPAGNINITAGHGDGNAPGGTITITAGNGGATNMNGANIAIMGGAKGGAGTDGNVLLAYSRGFVGVGTTSPGYKLDVNGSINIASSSALKFGGTDICVNTGCGSPSDINLKENIQPLDFSLEKILKLNAYTYFYKDQNQFSNQKQVGVIAQEVEKVFPEVVTTNKETGLKAVAYDHLVAPLIESVKSLYSLLIGLDEKQAQQEREIASLKEELRLLRQELNELKKK